MKANKMDLSAGVIAIILSVFLFYETFSFPPPLQRNAPSCALFPRMCLISIIIFAFILIFQSLSGKKSSETQFKLHIKQFLIVTGSLVLYLILLPYLGFLITSLLYLIPSLLVRMENRVKVIWLSCLIVVLLYVIFEIALKIKLPTLGL
jgi:hypothetical protein